MAKTETPTGVESTGFPDNNLIENCPLVITTIDCRPKDEAKKTYEFDETIPGNPKDTDAFFLKDIHASTATTGGFFGVGGTTYKVYEGTKVESDDLVRVPDLRLLPRKFGSGAAAGGPEEVSVTGRCFLRAILWPA